ncbi:hypothetical protein ACIQ6V_33375 [Streptomyces sp. NPDC096198]|uniref:AMIN-like domain-containing (lipo)protein n=1 Tax=Streptomyces sp. NPDC096198 TaxID=3366080 RepID=UPI0037FFF155
MIVTKRRSLRTVAVGAIAATSVAMAGTAAMAATPVSQPSAPQAAAVNAGPSSWGSGTKTAPDRLTGGPVYLKSITTSRSARYDRMVIDLSGGNGKLGYTIGYVGTFRADGSGKRIPVKGGAILQVSVNALNYNPITGRQTYAGQTGKTLPGVNLTGYKAFKDTRFGVSFEGQTQLALGVRGKLPFRVSQSGHQLIVDVARSW